jgi:hypothetical protein
VLVNRASVLEKADEVLLPAVYREVGAALGASPTALGSLTLRRARVVAVGAFLWAAAAFLVAICGTFLQVRRRPIRSFSPLFCSPFLSPVPKF